MPNKSNAESNKTIGTLLKKARKSRNVTMKAMSEAIGITPNHLSTLECGHYKPSAALLLEYCRVLNMTPNEVMEIEEYPVLPELKEILIHLTSEQQHKLAQLLTSILNLDASIDPAP